MKEWKLQLVTAMEKTGLQEISLRTVANEAGINHMTRQETIDVANEFIKRHPTYRMIQVKNPNLSHESVFTTLVVTEAQYESETEFIAQLH